MTDYYAKVARVHTIQNTLMQLCLAPYPGHPNGCPNYGRKDGCPPQSPRYWETLDTDKGIYVIFNAFDIGAHIKQMLERHPKWSDRQARYCLYWQGTARKQLREKIWRFSQEHPGLAIVNCPEAQGVDVTPTMAGVGVELEWPPRKIAYQIVLAGTPLNTEQGSS